MDWVTLSFAEYQNELSNSHFQGKSNFYFIFFYSVNQKRDWVSLNLLKKALFYKKKKPAKVQKEGDM